ncbi:ABC transporter permease [Kitasatospora sp. NPDC093806]|uniref:ABC transporter permease n=1 Tax=Kitasatospora sp. NPDC093806 TaxID=3155075 RepID=UPI003445172B
MTTTTMTTTTMTTTTPSDIDPRPRFGDLLAAEWIRFRSLRSLPWVLGVSALILIGVNLNAALYTYRHTEPGGPPPGSDYVSVALSTAFTTMSASILMLVAGGVGAAVIVGEYATGMIRTTLTAVPDRRALLLAKATVLTGVMLGYGALASGVSFGVGQALLGRRHVGVSITEPGVARAVAAAALLAPVCALVGFGLGVLIRHSAGTVVTMVLVLFLLPSSFNENHRWSAAITHAMPYTAWRRLSKVDLTHTLVPPYPATVAGSWLAFAGCAAVSVLVATVVMHRRDL